MNRYLMRIRGYFSGWKEFEIDAENRQDAVTRGTEYCRSQPEYAHGGNYDLRSIECVKKLKSK